MMNSCAKRCALIMLRRPCAYWERLRLLRRLVAQAIAASQVRTVGTRLLLTCTRGRNWSRFQLQRPRPLLGVGILLHWPSCNPVRRYLIWAAVGASTFCFQLSALAQQALFTA